MKLLISILGVFILSISFGFSQKLKVQNLTVEWRSNPLGLDEKAPRLSWQISSLKNNIVQTSYQVMIANSPEDVKSGNNLLWNSGKITSDKSILIPYQGTILKSGQTYYWKVKVWTNKGKTSWSKPASWSMALLESKDFKASWIGLDSLTNKNEQIDNVVNTRLAARYLRKEFKLNGGIKQAKLFVSGLGLYECFLNGKKVGQDIFAPTATDYDKRVNYNTYDVTSYLNTNNSIGVVVGNGRFFSLRNALDNRFGVPTIRHFGFPRLWLQLEIEYKNGEKETVVTDQSWKLNTHGPIVANSEYDGEEYNANLEFQGWTKPGFNDSAWMAARKVAAPKGKLIAQRNPNIKTMEQIKPISIREMNGKYIIDLGQNMVGWFAIKLHGQHDKPVVMKFAESLNKDGSLYRANLRGAETTNTYIPAKDGLFSWCPTFTYQGFRYVEISGIDNRPELSDFIGKVNYDEMRTIGKFETSDSTINQIYKNATWGIKGNYRSFPTDCPQRDERMPWLGDRATGCFGESFIFDQTLLYDKWVQDISDSQLENGSLPDVAPSYWTFYSDNITWPAVFIQAVNMLYEQRGDERVVRLHYQSMKKWMEYMANTYMKDYILTRDIYGDWCMPPESPELIHSRDPNRKTDGTLLATGFYYNLLQIMSKFAKINGNQHDQSTFVKLAENVKHAYNENFLGKEKFWYGNNTVTANLVSLSLGLVPEENQNQVFQHLVEKTEGEFKSHVGVGLIGIQFLMRNLDKYGRNDLSYQIATNRTYPSWGYMLENGATTIWELWNGNTADPAMNSGNHVMLLGDYLIWCYENLGGIKTDRDDVGFKKITMSPTFHKQLKFVNAETQSPYGKISSEWKWNGLSLDWKITIPANTTATVAIPAKLKQAVTVNGKTPESIEGIHFLRNENGRMVYEIGSGNYQMHTEN